MTMDRQPTEADDRLVTVYRGSMSEVAVVQPLLESAGLFTHVANQNIKNLDPFVTGMNVFEVELQVPERERERALEVLRSARPQTAEPSAEAEETLNTLRTVGLVIVLILVAAAVLTGIYYLMR